MTEEILQVFEGYIDSIDDATGLATVTLIDCTVQRDFEEMAEIDFATVNTNLRDVQPGNVFEWRIGNKLDDQGIVTGSINEFEFKKYTPEEIAAIKAGAGEAESMAERIAAGSIKWE
jgi:uncharacterized protein YijF (DUF1287 family)